MGKKRNHRPRLLRCHTEEAGLAFIAQRQKPLAVTMCAQSSAEYMRPWICTISIRSVRGRLRLSWTASKTPCRFRSNHTLLASTHSSRRAFINSPISIRPLSSECGSQLVGRFTYPNVALPSAIGETSRSVSPRPDRGRKREERAARHRSRPPALTAQPGTSDAQNLILQRML